MNTQGTIEFITAVLILWFGYSVGYRCRMCEEKGSYPAWLGIIILMGVILGGTAAFCGTIIVCESILTAFGVHPK